MIRKKVMKKKYYKHLFIVIFFVFTLIFGIFFYFFCSSYISKANEKQLETAYDDLALVSQQFLSTTSEIDTIYSFLLGNSTYALKYLNGIDYNDDSIAELERLMDSAKIFSPYISSIVLYNYVDDAYLTNDKALNMQPFLRTFIADSLKNPSAPINQKTFFNYHSKAFSDNEDITYLSIVYYMFNKNLEKYYCVVFNLDTEILGNHVFSNTQSPACIVNEYGSVAASHISYPNAPSSIPYSWITRASAGIANGHFTHSDKGKDYFVSYRKLEGTNWYSFVKDASKTLNSLYPPYLLLFLLTGLLASLAITLLLVRVLYVPINHTITRFEQIATDSENTLFEIHKNSTDEFAYINTVASSLSGQLQVIKEENKTQLSSLKRAFLRTLLQSKMNESILDQTWELYEPDLNKTSIRLILITIDQISADAPNPDLSFQDLLIIGLEKYFKPLFRYELTPINDTQFVILYVQQQRGDSLPGHIQKLQSLVSIGSNSVLTFVVAEETYTALNLHLGYKNVLKLLKERFVLGYGKIISQTYVDTTLSTLTTYPNDLINNVIDCIKKRDKNAFIRQYDNLAEFLSGYIYQDVIRILIHLITKMSDVMRSITVHDQYLHMDFSSVDELFNSVHTLKETREWFIQIFDQYTLTLRETSMDKNIVYWDAIEKALQEIHEHYNDPNLSIERISEHVGYSSNYFSKIFKSLTGIYLKDYIKNVRINHAQKLLSETDLTINEISNKTGFLNQNYFFTAFKKELGLTPAVYRSQHKKDNG